eukprot:gnl/TRDRNA2_/TRDRNA2_133397_c0_seq1.p1 gnl/TRDRNA2_/TRDRNA2_133397_c0~~gnl/TRDRNA2_/TRDRNA2_133397_c0_seq1.p1  ORF type:complete len:331 (+),score=62.76 gnl/TRDRNA2_/TRDRNA2_133397_c0_seq1:94-1086(+)
MALATTAGEANSGSYLSTCSPAKYAHIVELAAAARARSQHCNAAVTSPCEGPAADCCEIDSSSAAEPAKKGINGQLLKGVQGLLQQKQLELARYHDEALAILPDGGSSSGALEAKLGELLAHARQASTEADTLERAAEAAATRSETEKQSLAAVEAHGNVLRHLVASVVAEAAQWRPASAAAWGQRLQILVAEDPRTAQSDIDAVWSEDPWARPAWLDHAFGGPRAALTQRMAQRRAQLTSHRDGLLAENARLKERCMAAKARGSTVGAQGIFSCEEEKEARALRAQGADWARRIAELKREKADLEVWCIYSYWVASRSHWLIAQLHVEN